LKEGTKHEPDALAHNAIKLVRYGRLSPFLVLAALGWCMPGAGANGDVLPAASFGLSAFCFRFSRLPLCSRLAIVALLQ
jgi:hypothetical protein